MIHEFAIWLANIMLQIGYLGIFILMTLESTFFPFPSEVIIIPAGYLAAKGLLNIYLIILFGVLGSIFGAYINYFIADKYGRNFMYKNAKYFLLTETKLNNLELFFKKYGNVSTFFGRLLPVVRQYISFPAGLSKMPHKDFILYTGMGAFIWITFLTLLGYFIGQNTNLITHYLNLFIYIVLLLIFLYILVYKTLIKKLNKK